MSYPYDNDFNSFDEPTRSSRVPTWLFWLVLLAGSMILLSVALFTLPDLRKQWLESDPQFILKMREIEARAEADAAFRKREAELKAESEAAGKRLAAIEIPPSPLRDVVARTSPSVVNITASSRLRNEAEGALERLPFHGRELPRSEGSGVVVRLDDQKQAYILTNCHVVEAADRVAVTFPSGRTLNVDRDHIYTDKVTDLAVVVVDASSLDHVTVAEMGDSDKLQPGDWVLAIGSPFGLKQSVTFGIVSAKGRGDLRIVDDGELIQTDVAINPGNSGGPLLDLKGRIIGINTAIFTGNGGNQGVGFAIPSNSAQLVFEKLIEPPHKISRGYMGVAMGDLSDSVAAKLGLAGGVVVRRVEPTLPAAEAGLQAGDIIVRFDRTPVTRMNQLRKLVMATPPQTTVSIDVVRLENDQPSPMTFRLTLTDKPTPDARFERP